MTHLEKSGHEPTKERKQMINLLDLMTEAGKGDPAAKYELGALYLNGDGFTRNVAETIKMVGEVWGWRLPSRQFHAGHHVDLRPVRKEGSSASRVAVD